MIVAIRSFLAGSRRRRLADARSIARQAYDDALRRGDTRDQHYALERLRAATAAELRGVLGR